MAKHQTQPAENSDNEAAAPTQGKKGPTPRRREREAQNFQPLVPEDRKAASKQAREQIRREQAKAREGMARGEDQYLRPKERGPQKRFLRDFVDIRFTLGELLVPFMFLVIFATMIPGLQYYSTFALLAIWTYLIVCIVEGVTLGLIARKRVASVVGESRTENGFVWQAISRSMQMRFMRLPKARVKRFSSIEFTANYK